MSQTKLGDTLGITFQQIQKCERGTNRVPASRLWEVSHILGVPITYFYDDYEGVLSQAPSENTPRTGNAVFFIFNERLWCEDGYVSDKNREPRE